MYLYYTSSDDVYNSLYVIDITDIVQLFLFILKLYIVYKLYIYFKKQKIKKGKAFF